MATETELKLELDCDDMSSIAMLPWLNALADGPGSREQLESVYYDTGGFDLRDKGVSLRLRRVGGRMVQTIKAKANGKGGTKGNNSPFARAEWEHEIAAGHAGTSPAPDLSLAKGTALQPLVGKKLRRRLHPVFETSVRRCSLPLRVRDGVVELAIDRGRIHAGGESRPVHEVELAPARQPRRADRNRGAVGIRFALGLRVSQQGGSRLWAGPGCAAGRRGMCGAR